MNCCNANGKCEQGHGCPVRESVVDDEKSSALDWIVDMVLVIVFMIGAMSIGLWGSFLIGRALG